MAWTKSFDYSGAAQFDGQTGYVEVPNTSTFNIGIGPMTVMTWIRLSPQAPLAADTDIYNVVYKGSASGNGIQLALSGGTNNGLLAKVFVNGSCQQITPQGYLSTALSDGNWHHVAFKRDENGNADLFFDGNEISNAGEGRMSGCVDCTQPLWIGRGESDGFFNGTIEDVTILRSCASNDDIWNAWNAYNADKDGNNLPDWWEYKYFHNIYQIADAEAPRGDGLTLLEAYQQNVNPVDFYDGILPTLAIVAGGDQRGTPGAMVAVPISVSINAGVYNAPITFTVTSGSALLTATNGSDSVPASSVMVRSINQYTDSKGKQQNVAQVYLWLPNNSNDVSTITATAMSGTQSKSISTTVATIDTTLSAPTGLAATPTSPTTANLSWTPANSMEVTTIQGSVDGGATWFDVAAIAAGVNTLTITGMPTNTIVSFRAITGNVTGSGPMDGISVSFATGGSISSGGGGSLSSSPSNAKAVDQPIVMGKQAAYYGGYRYGVSDTNGRIYLYYQSTSGSKTTTITVDPKTGEYDIQPKPDDNGGGSGDDGGHWEGCHWIPNNPSPTPSSTTPPIYLDENSVTKFIENVGKWADEEKESDFTDYKDWAMIDLKYDGMYCESFVKLEYKFQVNSDPNGVLVWDVRTTDKDKKVIKDEIFGVQTYGATEVSGSTIDPVQLNKDTNITDTTKEYYAVYEVIPLPFQVTKASIRDGKFNVTAPIPTGGTVNTSGTLDLIFRQQGITSGDVVISSTVTSSSVVVFKLDDIMTNPNGSPLDNYNYTTYDRVAARWRSGSLDVTCADMDLDVGPVEVLANRPLTNYFSPTWGGTWTGQAKTKGAYAGGSYPSGLWKATVMTEFLDCLDPSNEGLAMDGNTVIRDRYHSPQNGFECVTQCGEEQFKREDDKATGTTAYICYPDVDQVNASGPNCNHWLRSTSVAVLASSDLDYGDQVYIPTFGLRDIDDRGGKKWNQMDIWMGQGDHSLHVTVQNFKKTYTCLQIINPQPH